MIDIERLAREAELEEAVSNLFYASNDGLQRFAALVRKEVLEEAAAFVEVQRNDIPACGFEFAAAIRALKNQRIE
jgi:hypothetical protein